MSLLKNVFILFAVLFVTVNADRIKVQDDGRLVCACPMNWAPVCASNGVSYANLCSFECARDEAIEFGRAAITLRSDNSEC